MNGILLDILVVLVAAKLAAELAERVGLPAVVGEILAGLAIGPSMLGLVEASEVLRTLGELGVILLLLQVGLEMDLGELGAVGKASMLVAVIGVVMPFAAGFGVMAAFGESGNTAIFVGAALTATSVGITARVFGDLGVLASVEARTVLGAAVADDVLGLIILTVVVRIVSEGSVSLLGVAGVAGLAVAFLVVTAGLGARLSPPLFGLVQKLSRSPGTLVGVALAFTLGVAELASAARLATVVGAFVAGLSLARTAQADRIRRDLTPVGHLFIPVFFLQIGIDADVGSFARPRVLVIAAALLAVAVVTKLAAAAGALGSPGDKVLIGLGMLPRGEVGLIFAGIGLREGILGDDLYGALLLVVLVTTLITPPLLGWRLRRLEGERRAAVSGGPVPAGGWLVTEDKVDLRAAADGAAPPAEVGLHIGLQAALAVASAQPSPRLLDWLVSLRGLPISWDRAARAELFELLRRGNSRSWRFLEKTGLLERALPELADAVRHRRADPFELDPGHALRFTLLDRVHELIRPGAGAEGDEDLSQLAHPEWLALAALLVEVGAGISTTRQVVQRLDLGSQAEEEIILLVGESGLLRAAAIRPDGLSERSVLQIAAHLEQPERARALYALSLAFDDLEPWQGQRLQALHQLVQNALELTGRQARNLAEERRAEAARLAGAGTAAAARLKQAPQGWLLTEEPEALARVAELLEPLPGRGEARVNVTAEGGDRFRIETACRDQRGLLAAITAALSAAGLDVLEAGAATWGDGGAADIFLVRATEAPDAGLLAQLIMTEMKAPLRAMAVPDARITFDEAASPWYTLCQVEAEDRPGLLHALATAFAACGVSVHSARIATTEGIARDRFELSDARAQKLAPPAQDCITSTVAGGVEERRMRRPRWRGGSGPPSTLTPSPTALVTDDA
ncbi:MAG TPA: cation:proton antiporter [Acidimicrobiales bacterium]|nr:cation:proton antiporter [Acidimicrobiales bacterium]